jgi:GT2 family glycosyltransferase
MTRPPCSIVVPFSGSPAEGRALLSRLGQLEVRSEDELIVVDNSPAPVLEGEGTHGSCVIVRATRERSSYYARNVGAEESTGSWILFMDADCRPTPGLLDAYFSPPPAERCGVLAGEVRGAPEQTAFVARWARWRRLLSQSGLSLTHRFRPFGSTANLLVRRAAFEDVGGFVEGARSGGDADLCWRLQEAGWSLEYRGEAVVEHFHRESLGDLLSQMAGYGRGGSWLERRFPECPPPTGRALELVRAAGACVYHLLRGDLERAGFRGLDGLALAAERLARPFSNRPPPARLGQSVATTVCAECFPADDAVSAARRAIGPVRVEAVRRPHRQQLPHGRELEVAYVEDDAAVDRLRALAAVTVRNPVRIARFAIARRSAGQKPVASLSTLAPAAGRVIRAGGRVEGVGRVGTDLARDLAWLSGAPVGGKGPSPNGG